MEANIVKTKVNKSVEALPYHSQGTMLSLCGVLH